MASLQDVQSEFSIRFPELQEAAEQVVIDLYLNDGLASLSPNRWGACYKRAVATWAAHYVSLHIGRNESGGASIGGISVSGNGSIKRAKADKLEVEFDSDSSSSNGNSFYDSTPYGRQYLQLIKECLGRSYIYVTGSKI